MKWINSREAFSLACRRLPYSCYSLAPSLPLALSSHGTCLEMLSTLLWVSMSSGTGSKEVS